ncbi:MAG TPA: Gfo/Idh/MocA family oxidoreductase [Rugosimonospora sp.]
MPHEPLRLGLVGAGTIAERHVAAATALPDVTITAIADTDLGAANRLASSCGAATYPDHTTMFGVGGLDAAVIAVPHALHAPITRDAAAAGLHILVEKPIATTIADATAMIDECRTAGVVLAVGHVLHFVPGMVAAQRLLRCGDLGTPLAAVDRRTASYSFGSRPGWFFDPVAAGGGVLLNVGIHSIDKLQWLLNAPAVRAAGRTATRDGLSVETEALALLEMAGGIPATVSLTGTGLPFTDVTEIVCTKGALRLSLTDGVWAYPSDGPGRQLAAAGSDELPTAFAAQLADFARACRTGQPPAVAGEYGRSVLATALAVYASADGGQFIHIPREESTI